MRITKYKTELNSDKHAILVKESACNYPSETFSDPAEIAIMLNAIFHMNKQTEEYLYLLCFNTKMRLTGIFEISHGTVNASLCNPREVFQKALLANASCITIAHNHPSGDINPSSEDYAVMKRMKDAGQLMNIPLIDSIIIGDNAYYSAKMAGDL